MTKSEVAQPALELISIDAGYGHGLVVRGVSITVCSGQVTALIGANGAGKTTLVRVAAGLLRPESGSVMLDGEDVTKRRAFQRARRGLRMVPEGRGIFRELTVRDNLYVQVARSERRHAVDQVVTAFPALRDRLNQKAGSMSGGQQQMLALARCYLSNPAAVVVDEVSIGLAPLVIDEIYESISELSRRGVGLLIIEQYVDRALALADEIHVLNQGDLVFSGPPRELDRDFVMQQYIGGGDAVTPGGAEI